MKQPCLTLLLIAISMAYSITHLFGFRIVYSKRYFLVDNKKLLLSFKAGISERWKFSYYELQRKTENRSLEIKDFHLVS
jgi:hypothetical protein